MRGIYQAGGIFLVIFLYYLSDMHLMRRFDHQRADQKSARAWVNTTVAWGLTLCLGFQPMFFPAWGWHFQAGLEVQGAGLLLCAAGLGLNYWARLHLGRFFDEGVEMRLEMHADHQVIETGPYRYIRHPIYVAFLLIATGLLLFSPSGLMLGAALGASVIFLTDARREETWLRENLPGYAAYMQRTPRFLPRLFGKRTFGA